MGYTRYWTEDAVIELCEQAIDLYVEYVAKHGVESAVEAKAKAMIEICEGLKANDAG